MDHEEIDAHQVFERTLSTILQRTANKAFGDVVRVAIETPDPELCPLDYDRDNPTFSLRMNNQITGTMVEIFRGDWARCTKWLKKGRAS